MRKIMIFFIVLLMAILVFTFGYMFFGGSVKAEIGETELIISAPYGDTSYEFEEIYRCTLIKDFDFGYKHRGFKNFKINSGIFVNDVGGNTVHAYCSNSVVIEITHMRGSFYFNLKTEEETKTFYNNLCEKLKADS